VATDRIDNPLVRHSNFIQDSGRWDDFKFRPDDIVISTPPKCGTSWAQMITALLIFQKPEIPAPLSTLSPWLDIRIKPKRQVFADLDKQTHRRFIKTHTPRWGLPIADGVTSFFMKARRGEWREILDNEQDLRRYHERAATLAPPELLAWIHRS
jgi:hypothetical protein